MKIKKHWELECDGCGGAEHFQGRKPDKNMLEKYGYIVIKNKVFCSTECIKRIKQPIN